MLSTTFIEKILIGTGPGGTCWDWSACRDRDGYGLSTKIGGRTRAHAIAYTAMVGPVPEGMQLDHLCRNRACVNPTHLEPVTVRENVLRGVGITAENARKTHCKNGHPLVPENLVASQKDRACRECRNARNRRYLRDLRRRRGVPERVGGPYKP